MLRTSYSQILNFPRDLSIGVVDAACRLVAQADHIPMLVGAMPWATRAVAAAFPDPAPGDLFLLNDPYHGGSHMPGLTALAPVFDAEGERCGSGRSCAGIRATSAAPPTAAATRRPLIPSLKNS